MVFLYPIPFLEKAISPHSSKPHSSILSILQQTILGEENSTTIFTLVSVQLLSCSFPAIGKYLKKHTIWTSEICF